MAIGKVYLVGAGPGDPELMTIKARRLLMEADVVLFDRLLDPKALEGVKAELIDVGKNAGRHKLNQEGINQLLIKKAEEGNIVVRLKGGDPYLFGRGGEEAIACREKGIPFEVVPGVTSAIAAPELAGIPVTHRGLASSLTSRHRPRGAGKGCAFGLEGHCRTGWNSGGSDGGIPPGAEYRCPHRGRQIAPDAGGHGGEGRLAGAENHMRNSGRHSRKSKITARSSRPPYW